MFAVKEVRAVNQEDFRAQFLENDILVRLGLSNHPNFVRQMDFFSEQRRDTTWLVMEALNGMTLLETLEDETQENEEMEEQLLMLSKQHDE